MSKRSELKKQKEEAAKQAYLHNVNNLPYSNFMRELDSKQFTDKKLNGFFSGFTSSA